MKQENDRDRCTLEIGGGLLEEVTAELGATGKMEVSN